MADRHHARLGLFLVLGAVLVLGATVFYALRLRQQPAIAFVTWLDESATGLGPGSPVRFRGVVVGRVDHVAIANERLLVEVGFSIDMPALNALGIDAARLDGRIRSGDWTPPPDLRVRQMPNLITGTSSLLIDRVKDPPPPILPGETLSRAFIPWAPSSVDSMVDQAQATLDRLPRLIDQLDQLARTVDGKVKAAPVEQLGADLSRVIQRAEALIERANRTLQAAALAETAADARRLIQRGEAVLGTVADLAAGDAGAAGVLSRGGLLIEDLRRLLPQAEESLRRLGQLARTLEEQPESLLFGHRRESTPGATP